MTASGPAAAERGSVGARLLRNAASNFGGFAVHFAVAFFLFPFTVAHIGAAHYGVLVLVTSVVGYSGLLQFGLRPALVKRGAEHLARGDHAALNRVTGLVFTLYCGLAGVLLVAAAAALVLLPRVFGLSGEREVLFRAVLGLVAVQAALSFTSTVWTALVEALQAHPVANAIRVTGELVRAAATVALLLMGYGLIALVTLNLVVSVLQWTASSVWVRRRLPELRVRLTRAPRAEYASLLRFSGAMFVVGLSGTLEATSDKLLIGVFAPLAALTAFEVGDRLNSFSRGVMSQVLSVLMPAASGLAALDDRAKLRDLLTLLSRVVVFAYGLPFIGFLVFGRDLIRLWMGPEFLVAYPVLVFLTCASFSQAHNAIAGSLVRGMGILGFLTRVAMARAVVNVVLTAVLIQQFGLAGVAFATLVAYVAGDLVLVVYYARLFQIPLPRLVGGVYLRSWSALVPAAGAAVLFSATAGTGDWPRLLAGAAVLGGVGAAAFWAFGMPRQDRDRLTGVLGRTLRRRGQGRRAAAVHEAAALRG